MSFSPNWLFKLNVNDAACVEGIQKQFDWME